MVVLIGILVLLFMLWYICEMPFYLPHCMSTKSNNNIFVVVKILLESLLYSLFYSFEIRKWQVGENLLCNLASCLFKIGKKWHLGFSSRISQLAILKRVSWPNVKITSEVGFTNYNRKEYRRCVLSSIDNNNKEKILRFHICNLPN